MNALTIILVVIFVAITFGVVKRFSKNSTRVTKQDNFRKLLSKTMGDYSLAERLIERERTENPNSKRATLINAAIARWERDNR